MNQPMGRVTLLQYRNIAVQPGAHPTMPVLTVHFRVPDGSMHHHDLPNGDWGLQNAALQFLALHGYQPTDLDGTDARIEDDQLLVPVSPETPEREEWWLAQTAMSGGQEALEDAEWFSPDAGEDGDSGPHSAVGGGGGPDPGTGNRAGVDVQRADEDSDAGVEVTVE